jgi:hypothetical protein
MWAHGAAAHPMLSSTVLYVAWDARGARSQTAAQSHAAYIQAAVCMPTSIYIYASTAAQESQYGTWNNPGTQASITCSAASAVASACTVLWTPMIYHIWQHCPRLPALLSSPTPSCRSAGACFAGGSDGNSVRDDRSRLEACRDGITCTCRDGMTRYIVLSSDHELVLHTIQPQVLLSWHMAGSRQARLMHTRQCYPARSQLAALPTQLLDHPVPHACSSEAAVKLHVHRHHHRPNHTWAPAHLCCHLSALLGCSCSSCSWLELLCMQWS